MAVSTGVKWAGGLSILAALTYGAYKVVPTLTKVARIGENVIVDTTFNRIHGLVNAGDFLQKLINPVLRVFFTVSLKNFSGFNLGINNAFIKLEFMAPGAKEWTTIGSSPTRFALDSKDNTTINKDLPIDIKGWSALTSLGNKLNKHRAVLMFDFKGLQQREEIPLNIAASINAYVQKLNGGSLKGTDPQITNLMQLCL